MIVWWETLGTVGQVFACVAIPATVILFLQTILMLIGIGGHELGGDSSDGDVGHDFGHDVGHDFDHDFGHDFGHDFDGHLDVHGDVHDGVFGDHDAHDGHDGSDGGLRLFSFRGIIAFLCVLGWVGVLCVRLELAMPLTILFSAASGLLAMVLIALLFRLIYSLQADGTENIRNALGVSGTVYLRIPPQRNGRGKVNLLLDGRLVEKEAVTDEEEMIDYGEQIVVIGISGGTELIVQRKVKKESI